MPVRNSESGFTLIEVLIGLAVSAALLALIVDLLTADSLQSRRFMNRGEAAVEQLQARRIFTSEAARATGAAGPRAVGEMQILPDALVLRRAGKIEPILRWNDGSGRFSYSRDGSEWRSDSADAEADMVRFTLQQGTEARIWIAP